MVRCRCTLLVVLSVFVVAIVCICVLLFVFCYPSLLFDCCSLVVVRRLVLAFCFLVVFCDVGCLCWLSSLCVDHLKFVVGVVVWSLVVDG